jgi:hypothetical protein
MCDYSLAGIPNRLAVEGEELVVHRFFTGSMGLTSPNTSLSRLWSGHDVPAVCMPPGARLLLRNIPDEVQERFGVGASEEVRFVQLSAYAYEHRDAIRFKNGREVLLQWLKCGQHVVVLSLSSVEEEAEHERVEEEYRRVFVG